MRGSITDWNKAIEFLEYLNSKPANDRTIEEKRRLSRYKTLAGNWVTCACGNQCSIIPRISHISNSWAGGEPKDKILGDKGREFYTKWMSENAKGAREVLNEIEQRSVELISEILKNNVSGKL